MDLGVREWFLILGGLMIVGVLTHGAWIFMRSRKTGVGYRYERNIPDVDVDDIELLRGELPSGGARVIRDDADESENSAMVEAAAAAEDAEVARSLRERARRPVNLDEQVPVLMDPIDRDLAEEPAAEAQVAPEPAEPKASPVIRSEPPARKAEVPPPADDSAEADADDVLLAGMDAAEPDRRDAGDQTASQVDEAGAGASAETAADNVAEKAAEEAAEEAAADMEQAPLFAGDPITPRDPAPRSGSGRRDKRAADDRSARSGKAGRGAGRKGRASTPPRPEPRPVEPPEDVIVIRVLSRGDDRMPGAALLEVITDQALRFGDMNIFHRYAQSDRGRIEFSLASAVEPGTFDLGAMDDFETPGVTLFMQLPGPEHPIEAFEDMVRVARALATELHAELKDEQHSVMTAQTIEHCRQRIREFTRRQMSRRA